MQVLYYNLTIKKQQQQQQKDQNKTHKQTKKKPHKNKIKKKPMQDFSLLLKSYALCSPCHECRIAAICCKELTRFTMLLKTQSFPVIFRPHAK